MRALRIGVSACAIALMMIFRCADADFIANCPTMCDCKWQSRFKVANCSQRELKEVPEKLSSEIQNVDLSNNPLIYILPMAFERFGLNSLQKLRLHDCKLSNIDKNGFSGLSIMTELDLSKNNIKTLHPSTFNETIKLMYLIISENKIERIEDGLFNDLPDLKTIDLRHNSIYNLGTNSFRNLPVLRTIFLNNNNLSHVKLDTINKLKSMTSLVIEKNPWKCDCYLESFRNWLVDHNLDTQQTACAEPKRLHNILWTELTSEDFACKPKILEPFQGSTFEVNGKDITLSCPVVGSPNTVVNWIRNSKILDYISDRLSQRYEIKQTKSYGVTVRWTNLTIINVEYKDRGEYTCIAKNQAGVDARTVSLVVNRIPGAPNMIIWSTYTVAVIFLVSVFCIFCISCISCIFYIIYIDFRRCENNKPIKSSRPNIHSSNEESLVSEMQTDSITTVNHLTKPLKQYYDTPYLVTSGGNEANKLLVDADFISTPNKNRSSNIEFSEQLLKRARETSSVDGFQSDGRAQCQPNLLSFPPNSSRLLEPADHVYHYIGLRTPTQSSLELSLDKPGLEQQRSSIMKDRPLPATPDSYEGPFPTIPIYTDVEEIKRYSNT